MVKFTVVIERAASTASSAVDDATTLQNLVTNRKHKNLSISFPVIDKLAILAFLYDLNLKIKVDTVVSHIYFGSKYLVKCQSALKFMQLVTIINLFPFEDIQKSQHFQLCVYYGKIRLFLPSNSLTTGDNCWLV